MFFELNAFYDDSVLFFYCSFRISGTPFNPQLNPKSPIVQLPLSLPLPTSTDPFFVFLEILLLPSRSSILIPIPYHPHLQILVFVLNATSLGSFFSKNRGVG